MNAPLDIMVTAGIWPRLVGGACSEMFKNDTTSHCVNNLRIWAWDTDARGPDGLVSDSLYAPPVCFSARNEARKLIEFTSMNAAPRDVAARLKCSLAGTLAPLTQNRPLMALVTLTSQRTLEMSLELLADLQRPILLIALADYPQDANRIVDCESRKSSGLDQLNKFRAGRRNVATVLLSRGAFAGLEKTIDDTTKGLLMSCLQHILWLIFTNDEPWKLVAGLQETVTSDPKAMWSFGHLQLDTSGSSKGKGNPICDHTYLKPGGGAPYHWVESRGIITVEKQNHLGLPEHVDRESPIAVHAFCESGKPARVEVKGISIVTHDTYLADRIDLLFLSRVSGVV